MPILAPYAAVLALMFVFLSIRTIKVRRQLNVAIGDAGDKRMLRAIRVHSNFAEYVPMALILIYLVEVSGASPWLIHGLALVLLVGRLSHAYGVSQEREQFQFRITGMVLTFLTLIIASVFVFFSSLNTFLG